MYQPMSVLQDQGMAGSGVFRVLDYPPSTRSAATDGGPPDAAAELTFHRIPVSGARLAGRSGIAKRGRRESLPATFMS